MEPKAAPNAALRKKTLQRLATWYVVALVLLVLSSATYFGQTESIDSSAMTFHNPLKPSYIYITTYGATLILVTAFTRWLPRPEAGLINLMVFFGVMHIAWLPFVGDQPTVTRTLELRLNVVVMTICFQIILSIVDDYRVILTSIRLVMIGTTLINAAVILAPDTFQVKMGVYEGRAAGLYWDPNQCATFICLMLPLATFGKSKQARLFYYSTSLPGVMFTFSRSGMITWVVAVLLDVILQPGDKKLNRISIQTNIAVAVLITGLFSAIMTIAWTDIVSYLMPSMNSDTLARVYGTDQGSSSERLLVFKLGLESFSSNPILGGGYAATRAWDYRVSVHNMFLLMLAEFGIIGGIWYFSFLRQVLRFPVRFGLMIGSILIVQSFFTHSYFDLPYYMLVVVIYWRVSFLAGGQRKTTYTTAANTHVSYLK